MGLGRRLGRRAAALWDGEQRQLGLAPRLIYVSGQLISRNIVGRRCSAVQWTQRSARRSKAGTRQRPLPTLTGDTLRRQDQVHSATFNSASRASPARRRISAIAPCGSCSSCGFCGWWETHPSPASPASPVPVPVASGQWALPPAAVSVDRARFTSRHGGTAADGRRRPQSMQSKHLKFCPIGSEDTHKTRRRRARSVRFGRTQLRLLCVLCRNTAATQQRHRSIPHRKHSAPHAYPTLGWASAIARPPPPSFLRNPVQAFRYGD